MSTPGGPHQGPDFTRGVEVADLPDGGMLLGTVHDEAVLLVRRGERVFAVAATCTHYGAPLADGVVIDGQVRCPWHHACFDVRTGEAVGPPALDPLRRWTVERRGSRVFVGVPLAPEPRANLGERGGERRHRRGGCGGKRGCRVPSRGGLCRSGDDDLARNPTCPWTGPTCRRTTSPGRPPRTGCRSVPPDFHSAHRRSSCCSGPGSSSIDPGERRVRLSDGSSLVYGALLLATGADPVKLTVPGADRAPRPSPALVRGWPGDHRRRRRRGDARWSWGRASSAWRWPRRCARGGLRCTWSRRRLARSSASSVRNWGTSSAHCTRRTA